MSRSLKNQLAEKNIIRKLIIKSDLDSMDFIAKYYDKWYGYYMGLDILWKAIADEISPKIKDSFIDVGCGTGGLLDRVRNNRQDIYLGGVDISQKSLEMAKIVTNNNSVVLKHSSPTNIPFEDESFSNGISTFSFNLWSNHIEMLNEIYRIMKHGEEFTILDFNGDEKYEESLLKDMKTVLKMQKTPYFLRKMIEIDIDCIVKVLGLFNKEEIENMIKCSRFSRYEIKERSVLHSSEHMFLEISLRK